MLKLSETADEFTVETGAIRFKVGRRRFAGIEEVALINSDGTAGKPIVSGAGGPFGRASPTRSKKKPTLIGTRVSPNH